MDDAFESCVFGQLESGRGQARDIRITLNRRAVTAAPAIVHNITMRSRPRVFLLVDPFM